jgi:hypothetical protein
MIGRISSQVLVQIDKVFYHGDCTDGIIAREILSNAFPNLKFIPYYFTEFKNVPKNALFIDCSPKGYQLEEALSNGCCIADHHEDSLVGLEKFPNTNQIMFGENSKSESGARLAVAVVEDFFGMGAVSDAEKQIATLISLSDTWQKDDERFPYARQMAGYISFFGNRFDFELSELLKMEEIIKAFGKVRSNDQASLARNAIRVQEANYKLAFVNEVNMSDAAAMLKNEGIDIIVGFLINYEPNEKKNIIRYSLRSNEKFNCRLFCKSRGGGGHELAAGFSEVFDVYTAPISEFLDVFRNYIGES